MKKILILLPCVVLLCALVFAAGFATKKEAEVPIENAGLAQNAAVEQKSITYKGQEYPLKSHLQTVLLIGTDSTEAYREQTDGVKAFYNYSQADFLTVPTPPRFSS